MPWPVRWMNASYRLKRSTVGPASSRVALGVEIRSASTGKVFTFPANLSGDTQNKHLLIATPGFAADALALRRSAALPPGASGEPNRTVKLGTKWLDLDARTLRDASARADAAEREAAATRLAALLHPHLAKEEKYALPPLGMLRAFADAQPLSPRGVKEALERYVELERKRYALTREGLDVVALRPGYVYGPDNSTGGEDIPVTSSSATRPSASADPAGTAANGTIDDAEVDATLDRKERVLALIRRLPLAFEDE